VAGGPAAATRWRVDVIGPCRLVAVAPDADAHGRSAGVTSRTDGEVELTSLQRALLARLALDAPRPVPADDLLDSVWGEEQPLTVRASLQNQVSRIRRAADPAIIVTSDHGYALGPSVTTDVAMLAALLEDAGRVAAGEPPVSPVSADEVVHRIDALLRGEPLPDLRDDVAATPARAWLGGLVEAAVTVRLEAAIRAGRHGWTVAEAEGLVAASPLDETRWALLARALDAAGRRGDALAAMQRARRTLRSELGVEPGQVLRRLEQELLDGGPPPATSADGPGSNGGARPGADRPVLRGRDAELTRLAARVAERSATVVVGEDGAGRTLLLAELVTWLRRARLHVIATTCDANPATPVAVLTDLAEELGVVDPRLGPVDRFLTALSLHAARRPVALVVDDLHLAGPTTRDALARAAAVPGVAVIASRSEAGPAVLPGAEELQLGPIDLAAAADVVRDHLGSVDGIDVPDLHARAGGNPFLLHCLVEDGSPAADESGLTATVTSVVRRRLGRLGDAALDAVRVAAVVGDGCRTALVHRLASERGLAQAQEAGVLLVDEGVVRFRHRVVAEVVHRDLPAGQRAELHHAAARLERDAGSSSAVVARHLLEAVDLDVREAFETAMRAGAETGALGAHRDAARWYALAAGAARGLGPDAARAALRADIAHGDELRLSGDPGHVAFQFDVLERAVADGDPQLIGDAAFALLQLGGTSEAGAANADAIAAAERALAVLEGTEQWAVVAGATSLACSMTGLADRSRELYLKAERRAVSPVARLYVLPFTYLGLGHADDLERRTQLAEELGALAAAAGHPVAAFEGHHLAFSVALQRADGPGVRAALAGMDALVDTVGDVGRRWQLLYCAAAVAHLEDRLDEAEQLAGASHAVFSGVSAGRAFAAYGSQLILVRLAQGRVAELAPIFEGLVASQPEVGAWHGLLALCIADADPDRAAHHAGIGLGAVPRDFTWLAAHTLGARGAARAAIAGATDAPLAVYRELLAPYAGRIAWQGTCAYGPVATALAELAAAAGDRGATASYLDEAERLAVALTAPVFGREASELRVALGVG